MVKENLKSVDTEIEKISFTNIKVLFFNRYRY